MDFLLQQTLNALQWGSFYALIALGYTLVYGVLRLINFAHGDIFMVGAYISFFVATYLVSSDGLGLSKPMTLWLTIVLTMGLTALVGVTLERIAYRPLRRKGAHRLYVVITALMCGLILENGNLALLGATKRKLPELIDKAVYSIGPLVITNLKVWVIVAAVLVFLFLQTIVTRTKVGMAMRAVSWDRFALPLMGIPLDSVIVVTFVLGSGIAGLGGMLFAVVGGIGDIRGAFVGGFMLAFVEIMVVAFLPSTYMDLFSFTILLLILWVRPTGIFGMPQTTKI